jgi:cbb3-type cytochrome oxidase subunit 3
VIPVKLYVYAGVLIAIVLCLLGGGWYAYSHGEKSQAAKDAQTIDQLTEARNAAIAQVADSAKALDQVNANARLEQLNAAVQKGQVEAAIEQLQAQKTQADSDAAAWKARFAQASATPACASVLKEELCPALSDY